MSGAEGVIASAVGKQLIRTLGKFAAEEITLQWRYREGMLDMEEKMRGVEAVLLDADEKLRRGGEGGRVFQLWLTKFKRAAYDAEDVLDELEAKELVSKSQSKVKVWFSRNNQLLHRITMPHKIKNAVKKIDEVEKEGSRRLNLVRQESRGGGRRNNETYAANNGDGLKTGMVGRDIEKEKIISLLLTSEANQDISIIPIVGIGGIGKTTLAESVRADKRVSFFHVSVCVNVSKLDLDKIGTAILKSMNLNIDLANCDVQLQLKKELATRRYLIVLDDLWEEDGDKLEKLKEMVQHGLKGSCIIVTTRNSRVVQNLRTGFLAHERKICPVPESDKIDLGGLSSSDCWELMKRKAFGPDDDHSGLEETGRQIAEKCGGSPLVANALGQVMSEPRNVRAWEEIRDTKVDLGLKGKHQKETLDRLMLSYYYMPPEFKMCFAYLAAFSKGFSMDSNRLIQQWNALRYIDYPGHDGERCINYLLGMSFLRIPGSASVSSSPLQFNVPVELVMHDLAHDLASIIVAEEYVDLDATKSTSWNIARYCRHARLTNLKNDPKIFKRIPRKLRSLHLWDIGGLELPRKAFSRSKYVRVLDLHSAKDQSAQSITVLPSSVNRLILIRYLDATSLPITSLPKNFHALQNMETLILSNSLLEILPDSICHLNKLCYLDLSGCSKLTELPDDFGHLQKLGFLNLSGCCKVSSLPDSFCELKKLEHLDLLDCHYLEELPDDMGHLLELGYLNLTCCPKLRVLPESLCKMVKLRCLYLSYCVGIYDLPSSFGDLKLQILHMNGLVNMLDCPDSIGDMTSLTQLVFNRTDTRLGDKLRAFLKRLNLVGRASHHVNEIESRGCSSIVDVVGLTCSELILSGLENVMKPEDAERVKLRDKSNIQVLTLKWDNEGTNGVLDKLVPPRTLEQLILVGYKSKDFPDWISHISSYLPFLSEVTLNNLLSCDCLPPFGALPNLKMLSLQNIPNIRNIGKEFYGEGRPCMKLSVLLLNSMQNLVEFWTTESSKGNEEFLIPNLYYLGIMKCPKLKFLPYPPRSMHWLVENSDLPERGFGNLSSSFNPLTMYLDHCSFSQDKWDRLRHFPTVEVFSLSSVSGLRTLPEGIRCLTSLTRLQLGWLEDLEILPVWLGHFRSLQVFVIHECCKVTSLPESMKNLAALRWLGMKRCKALETLPEWLGQLTCLEFIHIRDCPKMSSLPESIESLSALSRLHIVDCPNLVARCQGEDAHKISHIPYLEFE